MTLKFKKKAGHGGMFFKGAVAFAAALLILPALAAPMFAQASSEPVSEPVLDINLQINASWGGGGIMNLDIADLDTGERQQVAIRLSDFIAAGGWWGKQVD